MARTLWLLMLLAILAGGGGCASSKTKSPPPWSNVPFQQVDIGLCEDYPKASRSLDSARRDLELLRSHDIHVLRIAFPWDAIETSPGEYDWSFWDDFVRLATQEFQIRLIPYVCYTPRWASRGNATNFWRQPPQDNTRFAEFLRVIVGRYRGRIHSWELWNEPDNLDYWEGSAREYADLVNLGSHAVREADPDATVVLGGLAWNLGFLRELFATHQVGSNVDVVNLHCYYETWFPDPLEQIGDQVRRAAGIIAQFGNHQPIWLAEIGYSDYRRGTNVSSVYAARFDYEHTPQFQAESLGRAFASALATGHVQLIAWYRIHDLLPGTRVIGDENNRRLGVVDEAGQPKPVFQALTFFHSRFAGGFRCLDSFLKAQRLVQSDSQVHVFEKRDGTMFIIAWLKTVVSRGQAAETTDSRREAVDVFLPPPEPLWVFVYDLSGHRQARMRQRGSTEEWNWLPISLRGGEMRIYERVP